MAECCGVSAGLHRSRRPPLHLLPGTCHSLHCQQEHCAARGCGPVLWVSITLATITSTNAAYMPSSLPVMHRLDGHTSVSYLSNADHPYTQSLHPAGVTECCMVHPQTASAMAALQVRLCTAMLNILSHNPHSWNV